MVAANYDWDEIEDNIVEEYDDGGAPLAEYTTEPGLYGSLISQDRSGAESQHHFDIVGSTLAISGDSQQVTDSFAYSGFGELTEHSGSSVTPFQYIGKRGYYRRDVTGDYQIRRRWYLPTIARWASCDPAFSADGWSAYTYARNLPQVFVDPSGLIVVSVQPPKDPQCGERASLKIHFWLETPAPCDGYFVQKVDRYLLVTDKCHCCPKYDGFAKIKHDYTYYEAFNVRRGDRKTAWEEDVPPRQDFSDEMSANAVSYRCGLAIQDRTVKFYCRDPQPAGGGNTGDLGSPGVPPKVKTPPWKHPGIPDAGTLPSAPSKDFPGGSPPFWGLGAIEGPSSYRTIFKFCCFWNTSCCPAGKNYVKFTYPGFD